MGALHKPTEQTRAYVFALASFGVRQDEIADFLGISDDTLRKHYADELRTAKLERNAAVAAFLFRSANGSTIAEGASYSDCLRAAMFWLKTQAGWREVASTEISGPNGGPIETKAVNPDVASAIDAIASKLANGGNAPKVAGEGET
jgi:hypothetical protein